VRFNSGLQAASGDNTNWPLAQLRQFEFTSTLQFTEPFAWQVFADGEDECTVTATSGTFAVAGNPRIQYNPMTTPLLRGTNGHNVAPFDIPVASF